MVKSFKKFLAIPAQVIFTTSVANFDTSANEEYQPYAAAAWGAAEKFRGKIKTIDLFSEYAKLDLEKFYTFISESGNEDAGIKAGEIDFGHPNQLGNAYIAKILLKAIFAIEFDADRYIKESLAGRKNPGY